VTVLDGQMDRFYIMGTHTSDFSWGSPYGSSRVHADDRHELHNRFSVQSVQGIVQVAPPGKKLSTTSARTTCDWSVDTMNIYRKKKWRDPFWGNTVVDSNLQVDNVYRTGFYVEPPTDTRKMTPNNRE
jgi:hypothetical protein